LTAGWKGKDLPIFISTKRDEEINQKGADQVLSMGRGGLLFHGVF
jgi:hypothetical protein